MEALVTDTPYTKKVRRLWTEEERNLLKDLFADNYTQDICKLMNRSYRSVAAQAFLMGLKKSTEFMNMELQIQANRLRTSGDSYRYPKGHIPKNKGKKMPNEVYEKVKHTMFKKGQMPHNSYKDWEKILRKDKNGKQYWMIKVPGKSKLIYKNIWLWEQQNGDLPKGYNIVFRDGNQLNCVLENLECISNAELMQRNTIHRFPAELKSAIKLVNKLKKTIDGKEQN